MPRAAVSDILPDPEPKHIEPTPSLLPILTPVPGSNAWHMRRGAVPCETNPATGRLGRLREDFHARATVTIGAEGWDRERRHVCEACRQAWHAFNKAVPGDWVVEADGDYVTYGER